MKNKQPSLDEIASRISAHLKRFEDSSEINRYRSPRRTSPYYYANSYRSGNRVSVVYVSYQGPSTMRRETGPHGAVLVFIPRSNKKRGVE